MRTLALQKTGYAPTYSGNISEKLALNQSGQIIINSSASVAGTKKIAFKYAKAENTADQNQHIFDTFASLIGGSSSSLDFDTQTNNQTVIFEKGD